MPTDRMRAAANDLEKIDKETGLELRDLKESIEEVESIHQEHMKEMKLDGQFIDDLKKLFKEIKAIRQIDHHMQQEVQEYGNGNMSKQEFKQAFVKDEKKLEDIVQQIRTELEETVRILSNEERLTNRDLDIEDAAENLVRELNQEEEKLENAQGEVKKLVAEE